MGDASWKKVLLYRENTLDQFASEEIARAQNAWTSTTASGQPAKVEINLNYFPKYCRQMRAFYAATEQVLQASDQAYLKLEYADIAAGRFDKVCRFLGVDSSIGLATHLKKQNSSKSADKISNVDEVRKWLEEAGHEDWWIE